MTDLDSLVSVAEDEKQSSYKRRQAISDLLSLHPEDERSYTAFKKATQSNDAFVVREMVSSVKDVKAPKLLPILRDLLTVGDDYTKRDVIQVLGKNGEEQDIKILEAYCSDKSYSVSYAAKQAKASLEKSLVESSVVEEEIPVEASESETIEPEIAKTEVVETFAEASPEPEPVSEAVVEPEPIETVPEKPVEEPVVIEASEEERSSEDIPVELLNEERESLHDNSIFKDQQLDDVHRHYEDKSDLSFSEVAPALFAVEQGFENTRLKQFFGMHLQSAQALYKQLQECQKQLPGKEKKLSETRRRLTMLEADKADDIEISKSTVVESSKKSKDLEWEIKKAKLDIENLEKENKKFFASLLNSFSEDRQREIDEKKADFEKKLQKLKKELAESEVELSEDQSEVELLKQPLIKLQQELKNCESDRDTCLKRLMTVDKEINDAYLKVLDESQDVSALLSFLNEQSPVAQTIVKKLKVLRGELLTAQDEISKLTLKRNEINDEALETTKALGNSLERSFQTIRTSAKEKVRVSANVNFKEESSFFGGYSNASGSANGTGSATMRYEISEVKWEPTANLGEDISKFRARFEQLGEKSTEFSIQHRNVSRLENQIRQYVDYIRLMVEGADS